MNEIRLFQRTYGQDRIVRLVSVVAFLFSCLPGGGSPVLAQETGSKTVFTLGHFDGSSREFAPGAPTESVHMTMTEAPNTKLWYAYQPVSTEATPGSSKLASAPRLLAFTIIGQPVAEYTMRISLLIEHASVPAVHVSINGHQGAFYLDPKLDSRIGDGDAVSFPSFSQATVQFAIPGSFFHAGENEIAFSALAGGSGPQVPDAGFNYDAIELTEGANKDNSAPSVHVVPTIFYKQEDGHLREGVDVTVRVGSASVHSATLTLKGTRHSISIDPAVLWGEQRSRIYVPAFEPHTAVVTELVDSGRRRRSEQIVDPAKRWTVYVVPHVHFDLGYTDYQAKVASVQSRVIDEALDLFSLHPEFRFSMDGMWSFDQFTENRSADDKARAFAAIKAERLFLPAQYSNELTGFASGETLIRSLYPSANFSREHGTPLNYANITDVPSYSWSYASILASAGIDELIAGSNNGRAPVLLHGHLDETSPFYWQGPDGQHVLLWYSRHYHQMWTIFGLPPMLGAGEETLPLFLQMYGRPTYKASSTILYGSQVENTDLYPQQAELVEQWDKRFAFPHLQYAGFHEALASVAAQFENDIPTVRGDGGPYWEDGIAGDAYYAAMERETEARGPSAEKLATISSLANPRIAVNKDDFDAMWKNMVLMDEHTWTSSESFSDDKNDEAVMQLAVKDSRAINAHDLADRLLRHTMADLADSIDTPAESLVVYNTLNWQRSAMVAVDIRNGLELVDSASGTKVPVSLTDRGEHTSKAHFWAENIPAAGYKTYLLRPAQAEPSATAEPAPEVMENDFYRLTLDPGTGSVRSLFDKQLNRELVDPSSPYGLGQYLYVTTDNKARGAAHFVVHSANAGKLISIERTTEGITAHLESTDTNTPRIASTITLSSHGKKVLFTEDVDKTATKQDEGVYFAFPFAISHPEFKYEIQNGSVNPALDMYPGAGLDWFSVQHWASVHNSDVSAAVMPLDASLMTFGDISRLNFPETFGERKGTIFSYAMNNLWHVNYRAEQGGHFKFRYVVTSAPTPHEVELSHIGWEEMTPLEVSEVTPSDKAVEIKRPLDGKSGSFLQADDPALFLETWKPAEDGRGAILRFLDLGGETRKVRVVLPKTTIEHAYVADAVERDLTPMTLSDSHTFELEVKPHAIITIRVLSRITMPSACGRFCDMPSTVNGATALAH
jgi:alpha-mannosidase